MLDPIAKNTAHLHPHLVRTELEVAGLLEAKNQEFSWETPGKTTGRPWKTVEKRWETLESEKLRLRWP